jgi:hypothetical protein
MLLSHACCTPQPSARDQLAEALPCCVAQDSLPAFPPSFNATSCDDDVRYDIVMMMMILLAVIVFLLLVVVMLPMNLLIVMATADFSIHWLDYMAK